ncbi:hypothetical protein ElyMa_001196100 [Elysia marginata]|uniref:Uncharacterized protein n=1 Tax=Elysia marginata TaxID=1093978 RepID=A0AAV4I8B2_9GAST|nr:hypothetical protein ElyMa_001196100 [Elysia marginata]
MLVPHNFSKWLPRLRSSRVGVARWSGVSFCFEAKTTTFIIKRDPCLQYLQLCSLNLRQLQHLVSDQTVADCSYICSSSTLQYSAPIGRYRATRV